MLNQKDNDFDDLFRRASDQYPLRTDSADWDRMAAALDNPSSTELTDEGLSEDRRRRRRFLWLFLLLPLGGAGYYFLHTAGHGAGGHSGVGGGGSVVERTVTPGTAGAPAVDAPRGTSGVDAPRGTSGVDAPRGTSGVDASGGASGTEGKNVAGGGTAGVASGKKGTNAVGNTARGVRGGGGVAASAGGSGSVAGGGVVRRGGGVTGGRGVKRGDVAGGLSVARDGKMSDLDDVVVNGKRKRNAKGSMKEEGNGGSIGAAAGRVAGYPVSRVGMRADYRLDVNVVAPAVTKDSSKAKPKASRRGKNSFLYAGLMAAPDLSTVKFQQMKGVGTTFSLLVGYQFNKKWAVETGVSVDRKKYYTSAEYFDKKGLSGVPWQWEVTHMDGTCYMWEIPVNVRYNFSQSDKTSWFATAGLSTYFMTGENYNYQYYVGAPSNLHNQNWDVKKPSNYWFSIINLSAGYEHRIGNIGNLRIEPYLRIPMSGLGTGKLNILSGGLNIGITRRLW